MWKRSKVTDQTAAGQTGIRKKSKVPGVMITQFIEELPEGKTTPDFTRKPIALTIQEGKFAVFKAIVVGDPTPTVEWSRANGEIHFHPDVCLQKYDEASREHTIEFPKVAPEDADTYKCFASNEYGRAVCTVVLNVIAVGFSKSKELQKAQGEDPLREITDAADFRKKLKKRNPDGTREEKPMEPEEKVWEILLSAEKKDYEQICCDYGITDFRGMLKKLNEMKKEREEEIAEFVSHISTLKHIEVNDDDCATIELDMDLKDPASKIFLYKDGVMIPFSKEEADGVKHNLKQVGKKYVFQIKKLGAGDAGLYSVDVEGVNVFSTNFKVPDVEFAVKIQEVKAEEREDALFQCVLTAPMNEIKWFGKSAPLTNNEKYEIIVSEDKLIHKLIVKDCMPLDGGIYAAVAGIKSCNAFLIVEADKDPANKGKKAARKTTMAGVGNDEELLKIAKEQQERYQKEMEEKMEQAKKLQAEKEAADAAAKAEAEAARKEAAEAKAAAKAAAKAEAKARKAANREAAHAAADAEAAARKGKKDGAGDGSAAGGEGGAGAGEGDSFEDSDEDAEEGGKGGKGGKGGEGGEGGEGDEGEEGEGGEGGKRKKRVRDGPLVADTVIGDDVDDEETGQEGGKSGKKGKRGKKKIVGAEEADVGDDIDDEETGQEGGKSGKKGKRGKKKIVGAEEADVGDDVDDEETGQEGGKSGKKGKRGKKKIVGAEEADVGDDIDDEETSQVGGKSGKKGKHGKKKIVGAEEADVDDIDDEETGEEGGKSGKKGKRAKKKIAEVEEADVGDDIDDEETSQEGGKSGKKGKRGKKKIVDVEEADVGDDVDEETTSQEGGKSGKKGKRAKKKIEEVEEAVVEASGASGETGTGPTAENGEGADGGEPTAAGRRSGRARQGPLIEETVSDPGVHFHAGLSDCKAIIGEAAELECKLSSEDCEGIWYKDGEEIKSSEGITISKEGSFHRLKIHKVTEEFAGKYKFEADGRKTESMIVVEDPPRFDAEELEAFKTPVTVKKGHKATFKLSYIGREPIKVQWYLDGEELSDESNIKLEHTDGGTRLLLTKLQRKDSGEIKIKLKNEFGTMEAISQLVVLDKPTPPMGPLEIVEASASNIEFKWRVPKDSGGCKIDNYILERNQVGRNTWKKLGPIGPDAKYKDNDVDHGRRYCYRIRVETEMGTSELMETEDIQAGTKAYPGPPSAPKIVSAFKDCINLSWSPPANTGGTNILGYIIEKRKKGSNLWGQVNKADDMVKGKEFGVKDVVEGMEYEFRVAAINNSGAGEFSTPSEFVFARDPKKPPGKVIDFKVTDSTYTTLSLSWTKPKDIEGVEDEAKGYFVEIRPAENTEWDRCNTNAITMTSYTVKGMKSMAMYWVRAIATNDGGEGEPQELENYILAMPPPVRPRFTDAKIKSFMVVRAGNSARFNINFEASPWPEVIWLKDGVPVSKKVTVSNAEGTSQLLIASAERTDTGIYTILVKNIVGQETFSIEIRVTDEPKPPGPVEIDENVPGTVTVSWTASADEKRDDRLHYMVTKRDSSKRTWHTVADHIFNNKFTACNIMPGREYQFRVYAKNDMGSSKPSESPKWLIPCKKEKFTVNMPESKVCDLQCAPKFIVPLKMHAAPQGYECYMSCAIKGDPTPHVTWLRNNISLNTNTNYFISNTCGVCSLLILRVGSKDTGEYKVVAENSLGRAECSTKLTVRE